MSGFFYIYAPAKSRFMIRSLLLTLLFCCVARAQNVIIPDANFKARLIASNTSTNLIALSPAYMPLKIDANSDGEIQLLEAQAVGYLFLNTFFGATNHIADMSGIASFTNLKFLDCSSNHLTSLDLTGLSQLQFVYCYQNQIANLNLSGLSALVTLNCANNQIPTLDFTDSPLLQSVNCSQNALLELDFSLNPAFYDLGCANNTALESINIENQKLQNCIVGVQSCDGWANTALTSVCADAIEIDPLLAMLSANIPNFDSAIVESCALGLTEANANNATIFPNPSEGKFYISGNNAIENIVVFDSTGREIVKYATQSVAALIDLEAFASGIYYARIGFGQQSKLHKLIKR